MNTFLLSIKKHRPSFCRLAVGAGFLIGTLSVSTGLAAPPAAIAGNYKTYVDGQISDEFTAGKKKVLPYGPRWLSRADPSANDKNVRGGLRWAYLKNNILHCVGRYKDKNAGGIVSKNAKKYGFYETRWRGQGFKLNKQSPFHPSIWMAETNGHGGQVTRGPGGNWLEIDFIEYEVGKLGWSSDAPPFVNGRKRKNSGERAIMVPRTTSGVVNQWNVHGLEYTPDYLQVWRYNSKGWKKIGKKVNFKSGNTTNETTVPKSARTFGYWYIGNLWLTEFPQFVDNDQKQNTKFMVDYFRLYARK